ncbi:hypothetical protein [Roseibium sediminis]|uniref:hypothetical protein n=1 Tax=Roseibium sediminis TaxID=1775174 RepID=UPI001AD93AFF|nr:hypothetical protein [Roseibium sediminis]
MTSDKDTSKKPGSSTGSESNKPSGSEKETVSAANPTSVTGSGSKKRPVTIDLKPEKVEAKEPETKTGAGATASASDAKAVDGKGSYIKAAETKAAASSSASSAASASATTAKAEDAKADASKAEEKKPEPAKADASKQDPAKTAPSKTEPATNFSGKPEIQRSGAGIGGLLAAAVVGGCVSLGGAYLLISNGMLPLQAGAAQEEAEGPGEAEKLIADLQAQVDELSQTVRDSDPSLLVSGLNKRLAELETAAKDTVQQTAEGFGPALDEVRSSLEALQKEVKERGAVVVDNAGNAIDTTILQPLEEQLKSLSGTVDELLGKSEETSGSAGELKVEIGTVSESLAALKSDLDGVGTKIADLTSRLQNAEATAKAAQTAVSTSDVSLKTLSDTQARASEALSGLSADINRLSAADEAVQEELKAELATLSSRLAAVEATMGDATARELAARALSVSALKSAVDSGRPYVTELAAVKAGLSEDTDLAALEAHASSGVAPVSVLIAEFPAVAREIHGTFAKANPSDDVVDSLLSSALSIVSVRGPGDADGTGPDAVLRRMENAVAKGNLSDAIAAYPDLPEAAKAAGEAWIERAKARVQIEELTDKASQDVLAGLARKGS